MNTVRIRARNYKVIDLCRHLANPRFNYRAICRRTVRENLTTNIDEVNCKHCLQVVEMMAATT
jgi:hypothetical protein